MQRETPAILTAKATVTNIRVVYPSFASTGETFSQALTLKGLVKAEEAEENANQEPSHPPESMPQASPKDQ
jgi:hypothetical protein